MRPVGRQPVVRVQGYVCGRVAASVEVFGKIRRPTIVYRACREDIFASRGLIESRTRHHASRSSKSGCRKRVPRLRCREGSDVERLVFNDRESIFSRFLCRVAQHRRWLRLFLRGSLRIGRTMRFQAVGGQAIPSSLLGGRFLRLSRRGRFILELERLTRTHRDCRGGCRRETLLYIGAREYRHKGDGTCAPYPKAHVAEGPGSRLWNVLT